MEKPCEICGNTGWLDALTICSKCKVTREHLYCMRIMHEDEKEKWVCEECDSNQIPLSKLGQSNKPNGTGMRFMLKKPPQNAKVRYLPPEELIGLESGGLRNNSSAPSNLFFGHRSPVKKPFVPKMEAIPSSTPPSKFSIKPNPPVASSGCRVSLNNSSMRSCLKDKNVSASTEREDCVFQKEHYRKESPVAKQSSPRDMQTSHAMMQKERDGSARQYCGESPTTKRVTFGKLPKPGVSSDGPARQFGVESSTDKCLPNRTLCKDDTNSGHASQFVQPFPTVGAGSDLCTEAQPKNFGSKGRDYPKNTILFDTYLPNHPAVSPTWEGTLKIISDVLPLSFFVQAHPPCKVHRKAYNLSKQLPETLPFEMLPRQNVWVEMFGSDVPDELDIGLYFLPSLTSNMNGQSCCTLLDYLDGHDLLLKCYVGEVELFAFSSKHLQEDSQEINRKSFLWGLFRPSGASAQDLKMNIPDQVQQSLSGDMNIDMVGGHEVGSVDVVLPKPADITCEDRRGDEIAGNEIKSSLTFTERETVLEVAPIKVETLVPSTTSCLPDELEFEKELQRSFDNFAALMQQASRDCVMMEVKKEVDF